MIISAESSIPHLATRINRNPQSYQSKPCFLIGRTPTAVPRLSGLTDNVNRDHADINAEGLQIKNIFKLAFEIVFAAFRR
jgi:pSer/pThr/pTyr-binding forkhead associated (FHA) protein